MGNLIFKDSKTTRSKTLVMAKPEDDIVLILPDNPGILATTNTLSQELYGGDTPIDISNILKPNILENNGGIVDSTSNNKPLERASYRTTNAYKGKLDYTEWIAATDALFKNIIDHTTDKEHVDRWLPNIGNPSTKVFVRYRFHSGVLKSPWSDSLVYTTPAFGIYKFTVTVDSRTMSPTITTSGYRAYGENVVGNIRHIATSWKIYEGSELVYSSEYNTTDKLVHTVSVGYLDPNTNYRVAVTYHSDNKSYRDSPIGIADFITPNIYIKKPIIAYKYKSGVHTIDAEPYVIVGSNEPHVATTWEVYRFENDKKVLCYRKEQDRDRLTTIAINDYLYGKIRKYEVVATFHSDTYQSAPGKTKFEIVDNKIEDAVLTVTGNTNELPTMKILAPGFAIEGDTDKVVRTAFKVNDTITGKETLNLDLTTFIGLGRYTDNDNPPSTALSKVTDRFFYSWFDSEADNNGELPMVTLSGYLVGDKYNSPMLSTNYIPNLDYKVPTTIKPLTNMLVKVSSSGFRYAANAPLKLQIEEIKYIVSGGKYFNKVVKHIDNAGVRALESNPDNITNSQAGYGIEEFDLPTSGDFVEGYDYGKNYTLYVRIKTQIGWINVSKQNFSVYQGKISDPNGTIGHDIAGIGRCRLTILSNNYSNDMLGKVPGSEYKHTNIKVYKVSDGSLVADVNFPRDIGTVPAKISALDYNGIDWNTNYNIDITYEAVNGLRSKTVRFPYGTPMKPEIRVTAPTVTATTNDRVIIATGSPFSIVGTEDKSHYSTTWELYDDQNTLLYRYPKDTEHLTSIEFPNTLIEYGKTYRVQAIYHGVSDISSGIGFTNATILTYKEWDFILYSIYGRVGEDLVMSYSFNLTPEYCLGRGGFPTGQYKDFSLVRIVFEGGWSGYGVYTFPPKTERYSFSGSGYRNGSNSHNLQFGLPGKADSRAGGAPTDRRNYKALHLYCTGYTLPKLDGTSTTTVVPEKKNEFVIGKYNISHYEWYSYTGNHKGVAFYPTVYARSKVPGMQTPSDLYSTVIDKMLVHTVDHGWEDLGATNSGTIRGLYGYYFRIHIIFKNGMIIDGMYRTPQPDQYDNLAGDFVFKDPHVPTAEELEGVPDV